MVVTRSIRVIVAEDSPVIRALLVSALQRDPHVEVVADVACGDDAVALTKKLRPDVVSMDVVMPGIDGVEATRQIMASQPTAVVLVTALASVREDQWTMKALASGALAAISKPTANMAELKQYVANIKSYADATALMTLRHAPAVQTASATMLRRLKTTEPKIILVGASSGGPRALTTLLGHLRDDLHAPVLLVQHVSSEFFSSYLGWIASATGLAVEAAQTSVTPQPGRLYVAPPDSHMGVREDGSIVLRQTPPANFCRPSVTELFKSAVQWKPKETVGIVLSGMGADGAAGTRSLTAMGGTVIAQDATSSVVYGMPRAAAAAGAVTVELTAMNELLRHWSG